MGYGSGRLPVERASKLGHMQVIEHEQVRRLLRQFECIDSTGDAPIGECTGHLDLATPSRIRFVIAVDGGQALIPNELRRGKRVAFIKFAAMLIRRADIARLRQNPIIDPRDLARLFEQNVWYQPAVLPLAGIHIQGETVRDTIRSTVDAVLEYSGLYEVLDFLVFHRWDNNYARNMSTNPEAPHMDCLGCGQSIQLPGSSYNFICPSCRYPHRLSDYLGIAQDMPDDWAREEAVFNLRNALETLTLFHFVKRYAKEPDILAQILFIKDGPLLLRAQLSRLVEPIRAFLTSLRTKGIPLFITGIEKNGELVDHIDDLKKHLTAPGDYFLPTVRYLVEEVAGHNFDPVTYRNRVQYGAKVVIRLGPDHIVPLDIPTGEFYQVPTLENLIGFSEIASVLVEMLSYSHDNALIPIKLANEFSSIAQKPSGDILKAFAGGLFGN